MALRIHCARGLLPGKDGNSAKKLQCPKLQLGRFVQLSRLAVARSPFVVKTNDQTNHYPHVCQVCWMWWHVVFYLPFGKCLTAVFSQNPTFLCLRDGCNPDQISNGIAFGQFIQFIIFNRWFPGIEPFWSQAAGIFSITSLHSQWNPPLISWLGMMPGRRFCETRLASALLTG